jgi:hypothetical protein
MMRKGWIFTALLVVALTPASVVLADDAAPDLNGDWRLDAKHSDQPQMPQGGGEHGGHGGGGGGWGGGGGGHHGGGGWGGGGGGYGGSGGSGSWNGGGGHHHGGGGGSSADGSSPESGGQRPARLPDIMHVTQTAKLVSFEDSTGAVIREVATVPAEADTFARAPGAQHVAGTWQKDKLVIARPGPRDSRVTETISLKDKGKTMVIDVKVEPAEGSPVEFKRVYERVSAT